MHMTVHIEAVCLPHGRWGSSSSEALHPSFFPPLTHYPNRSTPTMLSSILKPAVPIDPIEAEKTAAKEAFKPAVTSMHAVAVSRPGDSDTLGEEWMAWVQQWKTVAPGLLGAHKRATDTGIPTIVPHAIMQQINEANEAYRKIADSTATAPANPRLRIRVGSPMVEDPIAKPLRASSPTLSISSRATGHSKMEVVIDKGKGKKSRQDLTQEESVAEGMITHARPCKMCLSTQTTCVGPQGKSCMKCTQRKTACVYAMRGKAIGGSASAAQPACPTAAKAGPSTQAHAVSASEEEEEEIVVVKVPPKTGKGKRKGRAITLNKQEADKVTKIMMGFEGPPGGSSQVVASLPTT
ncbi:hypothetical protein PAXINDRAFT_16433 [Paxillus involutus ATCC 200175]|uniref:Uncharacterized protein n=1 Tax=Paxillus involutus ATCC 200175 TaxID=664439 RepID=A0A0C9SRQ0_PAXIN|nr:hypothetical protein PAXINDRAFT_16433 [Paxillus involutus ATCC 200175]